MRKSILSTVSLLVALSLMAACGPTPEVVEKEVQVTVEVEVTRVVEVAGTPVVETVVEEVVVTVPPGVRNGTQLRLRGKGMVGKTAAPGDLYLRIHITD